MKKIIQDRLLLQPRVLQGLFAPFGDLRIVLVEALQQPPPAGFDVGAVLRQVIPALICHIGQSGKRPLELGCRVVECILSLA